MFHPTFLISIGGGEIFFILLMVLMLFGADKIPEIARGLGKGMREVKNAANDIKREVMDNSDEDLKKFKEKVEKEKKNVEEIAGSIKRNLNS